MKATDSPAYREHYRSTSVAVIESVERASKSAKDVPRFLQRLWEGGFKISPVNVNEQTTHAETITCKSHKIEVLTNGDCLFLYTTEHSYGPIILTMDECQRMISTLNAILITDCTS